jgi:hypothetical protein
MGGVIVHPILLPGVSGGARSRVDFQILCGQGVLRRGLLEPKEKYDTRILKNRVILPSIKPHVFT